MDTVKLSVTVRARLERKYDAASLARIDAAVKKWIAADRARGIRTIHVAVDDAAAMRRHRARPLTGRVTPNKVKRAVDQLRRRYSPEYLVLFGADDVVPHFEVENPSYDPDGDDDERVPTDNPYASDEQFRAGRRSTYLVPDAVVGRIPDLPGSADAAWFTDYLTHASRWTSRRRKEYADAYAICCASWEGAGRECVREIGESSRRLMMSPPRKDDSTVARRRLASRLHLIKCHGSSLDSRFYGQRGSAYPVALDSGTLRGRVSARTVVGAMCCYGAGVFSPDDPAAVDAGAWPIASTYLRRGAWAFAGSTTIAWVGTGTMMCADWIVAGYLKAVLDGASVGRALLEAKQGYLRWLGQQGQKPDVADEKTLLQFVLLGDPSIHPVKAPTAAGTPTAVAGAARAPRAAAARADAPFRLRAAERRARRAFHRQLAGHLRAALPVRSKATPAARRHARDVFAAVRRLLGAEAKRFRLSAQRARVEHLEVRMPVARAGRAAAKRGTPVERMRSTQYAWSGAWRVGRRREIRLVTVETDAQGNVVRSAVLVSSAP